ncbi:MAG: hypothetical protein K6E14_11325 [Paludibacteraceae bacterium]|nr:hypothetical protein [Paludibacteraceae bacterium]
MGKKLTLPLKREWFDMIKSRIKTEEYRDINEYWITRLFPKSEIAVIKDFCLSGLKYIDDPMDRSRIIAANIKLFLELNDVDNFEEVEFTLGYPRKSDHSRRLTFRNPIIRIGYGRKEWGADISKQQFIITWDNEG